MELNTMLSMMGLHQGRIITPTQAAEALSALEQAGQAWASSLQGRTLLVATVSERMGALLGGRGKELMYRLAAYTTPDGEVLLVLTVQLGYCQARVLLDMHDPLVQAYLAGLGETGELTLVCLEEGQVNAYPLQLRLGAEPYQAILAEFRKQQPPDDLLRLQGLATMAAKLLRQPDMLRFGEMPIEELTVTTVVPTLNLASLTCPASGTVH